MDGVTLSCADVGVRHRAGLHEGVLSLLAPVTQELALCFVAEQALGPPKSY